MVGTTPSPIMFLTQYQRALVLLTRLGYKPKHIAQFQGMVDAILEDYDELLRLILQRLALTSEVVSKVSMTEGMPNFKTTRIVDRNDELIDTGLEFIARKHFERIPFDEMGFVPFEAKFDEPDILHNAARKHPVPKGGTGARTASYRPPRFGPTVKRRIKAGDSSEE